MNVLSSEDEANTVKRSPGKKSAGSVDIDTVKYVVDEKKETEITELEDKTTTEDLSELKKTNLSTQSSLNFKEFSTQLYSCLSTMQEPSFKSDTDNLESTSMESCAQVHTDEFIDNKIYKLILSGNKNIEMPPGFEINHKEAKEIEELGKKLATFQIETDTEIDQSIFNSSNSSSNSGDADESRQNDGDAQSQTAKM